LFFFCANQSARLRVKFDGFHAALENAAWGLSRHANAAIIAGA
jgi:hypothetical protein